MEKLYQKIKGWLANQNMFHVLYLYLITNIFACVFQLMDTYDKALIILGSWALGIIVAVFVESFDGYFGTKQEQRTGIQGNSFSVKDLMYGIIGATLGAITIAIMIL